MEDTWPSVLTQQLGARVMKAGAAEPVDSVLFWARHPPLSFSVWMSIVPTLCGRVSLVRDAH